MAELQQKNGEEAGDPYICTREAYNKGKEHVCVVCYSDYNIIDMASEDIMDFVFNNQNGHWILGQDQVDDRLVDIMKLYVTYNKGIYAKFLNNAVVNSVMQYMGVPGSYLPHEIEFATKHTGIVEQIAAVYRSLYRNYRLLNGAIPPHSNNVRKTTINDYSANMLRFLNLNKTSFLNAPIDPTKEVVDLDEAMIKFLDFDLLRPQYEMLTTSLSNQTYQVAVPIFDKGNPYIQLRKESVFYVVEEGDEETLNKRIKGNTLAQIYGFTAPEAELVDYNGKKALLYRDPRQSAGFTEKISLWGKVNSLEEIYNCFYLLECDLEKVIANFLFDYIYDIKRTSDKFRVTFTNKASLTVLMDNDIFGNGDRAVVGGKDTYIKNMLNYLVNSENWETLELLPKGVVNAAKDFIDFHLTLNVDDLLAGYSEDQIQGVKDRAEEIRSHVDYLISVTTP